MPVKALVNICTAQDFADKLKDYILLSSGVGVAWSEPENIYFPSYNIRCILIIYGNIPFNKLLFIILNINKYLSFFEELLKIQLMVVFVEVYPSFPL